MPPQPKMSGGAFTVRPRAGSVQLTAVVALLAGCGGGGADGAPDRRAEELLRRQYPDTRYVRVCASRIPGGEVFTFRIATDSAVEHADTPVAPVIIVPDTGEPRHLAAVAVDGAGAAGMARRRAAGAALDSGAAIAAARPMAPAGATLHCVLPIHGGAWVQFVTRDSGPAVTTAHGVTVAVGEDGGRAIAWRF